MVHQALKLKENGLYIIASTPPKRPQRHRETPSLGLELEINGENPDGISSNKNDHLSWGFYFSKAPNIGTSIRYEKSKTDNTWKYTITSYPSASNENQKPIEEDETIILALHIENMTHDMAVMLQERLAPKTFHHSHSQQDNHTPPGEQPQPSHETKCCSWLQHALVGMEEWGFISMKDMATRGASLIRCEALSEADGNYRRGVRSVVESENMRFDQRNLQEARL